MIRRLVGGAVNLSQTIKYAVQDGWARIVLLEWPLPLTRLRAAESGVNRCVFNFFIVVPTLMFVALWPVVAIPGFLGSKVAGTIASTSQPAVFSRAEAGHECGKGCHGLRFFLAEVSGKPLVADIMLKGHQGLSIRTVDNLFFSEKLSPEFPG